MRIALVALAVIGAVASTARADEPARLFAHFYDQPESALTDVRGFALPAGSDFDRAVVASFPQGDAQRGRGLVLLRCDERTCRGERRWLEPDSAIAIGGVIDLDGTAAAISTRDIGGRSGGGFAALPAVENLRRTRARWPALVVMTRHEEMTTGETRHHGRIRGTARRHHLQLISLRRSDAGAVVFAAEAVARGASGAGTSASFRLERPVARKPMVIVGTVQRHLDDRSRCRQPDPVLVVYRWAAPRFVEDAAPRLGGCGG